MRFEKIQAALLITDEQRRVVQSSFVLLGLRQSDWASAEGLDPASLSKMLRGHWALRPEYAGGLNALVARAHPVRLAAQPA